MDIEQEILGYGVSRETLQKLQEFVELLRQWNVKINLISQKSMNDVWLRHVLDSAQLVNYLSDKTKILVDIGSGSGFPAVVLAILAAERFPLLKISMVESIKKKTLYLNDVTEKLCLKNVNVINERVENAVFKNVDVVTARAVAGLDVLLSYQHMIGNKNTLGLYLKGKKYDLEIASAAQKWQYDLEICDNLYSDEGKVLQIKNLRIRK